MWPGYAESKALRCQHSHRFDVAKYYSMTRKYLLYAALACARGPGAGTALGFVPHQLGRASWYTHARIDLGPCIQASAIGNGNDERKCSHDRPETTPINFGRRLTHFADKSTLPNISTSSWDLSS